MDRKQAPLATPRRDGWTADRRRRFVEFLAAGVDVRRACAGIGLSRQAAYKLRRRDPAFALAWDDARQSARAAARRAWLAMLPEGLRRTMADLSGECKIQRLDFPPRTVSELSGACKLRAAGTPARDRVTPVSGV
jgi:hypothetical protein